MKILILLFFVLFCINNVYSVDVKYESSLNILLNLDEVKLVETIYPPNEDKLINSKVVINSNFRTLPIYNLSGNEIKILQYEGGIPADGNSDDHPDIADRIQAPEFGIYPYGDSVSEHATHVAGIMIGNGGLNSSYIGIAPKARVVAFEIDYSGSSYNLTNDIEEEYEKAINNYGALLASNSWGIETIYSNCPYFGDYTLVSALLDNISRNKNFPIIWANGNERVLGCTSQGYGTVLPKASAKNVISVGAIKSNDLSITYFSSFGPTDDGRIKPELVAPGHNINSTIPKIYVNESISKNCNQTANVTGEPNSYDDDFCYPYDIMSGTSMAAPHVSGTIALMLEQWNKQYTEPPIPSTIKALLLDSTTDLSKEGDGTQIIDGPDYKNGYGLLNAKETVDRIINETFIEDYVVEKGDIDVYAINLQNKTELKVTLAWDDIPNSNLINDLDLKLISPTGKIFYPWTLDPQTPQREAWRNKSDHLNNVEQVYVNESDEGFEQGEWLIVINVSDYDNTYESQKYSLVSKEKIKPSRIEIVQKPEYLQSFKYINNGIYEAKFNNINIINNLAIILGDYSYSTNFSENERKVFLIKQANQNLPIYHINYEVTN